MPRLRVGERLGPRASLVAERQRTLIPTLGAFAATQIITALDHLEHRTGKDSLRFGAIHPWEDEAGDAAIGLILWRGGRAAVLVVPRRSWQLPLPLLGE